jgi:hypothetical protein
MPRLSLREMLGLVAVVALAIVSLRQASSTLLVVVEFAAIIVLATAALAVIFDRGPRRAFAGGFLLIAIAYGVLVLSGHKGQNGNTLYNAELGNWIGWEDGGPHLPTSKVLQYAYQLVDHSKYFDPMTEKQIPNVSAKDVVTDGTGQTINGQSFYVEESPSTVTFFTIGQYWWGLLFAYVGGRISRFIFERRTREQAGAKTGG